MASEERLICASVDLPEAGAGVRFEAIVAGQRHPAFAIRFRGVVHAFLNRCGHVPAELDFQPGEFFDDSRLYLTCSVHGALYDPEHGRCLSGRCNGRGLLPLEVVEREGAVFVKDRTHV